ncbi:phage holin family protein [Veillonella sp.]|jgi:toxin secretion/phage lysis holin|uniref:phage holin family protein n=1 Tax=Veillonella sp. TaxID=1926307 RepID=UPI00206FE149|nr:phage holin family protein [Veillonella sp.]DAT46074.1 MAG TPA: holin [Caudoviricetes sp.]
MNEVGILLKSMIPVKLELEVGGLVAIIGTIIHYFLGQWTPLLETLIIFMLFDYITGVMSAWINPYKKLDSRKGMNGLKRKGVILIMVMVGHFFDNAIGQNTMTRDIVALFYLGNEGLSILENVANCGVPVPNKLKDKLAQFADDKTTRN